MRSTKAVIYMDNLRNNLRSIRSVIRKETKMCVAVKADAYGHGAVTVAKEAVNCGTEYLAVATVDEGIELRKAGISCSILILSLCIPDEIESVVQNDLTPLVFDSEYISLFEKAATLYGKERFAVHLAVDTGMGRIGCLPEQAVRYARQITDCRHLKLEGMCTHFAVADSVQQENRIYTESQFKTFLETTEKVRQAGINPGIRHCASSAALLDHPEMQLDMVRPGIITYGYYPDQITEEYLASTGRPVHLKPVMALESAVVAIRPFESGKSVSYGRTWTACAETDIAVLPAGYGDGLLRRFSPGLQVAINGKAYPVRGRICMDQCMVDIGRNNREIKRWDKVLIFGPEESGALQSADTLAKATGTISYEILTAITKRVPRIYL
jgi:alanine racemase